MRRVARAEWAEKWIMKVGLLFSRHLQGTLLCEASSTILLSSFLHALCVSQPAQKTMAGRYRVPFLVPPFPIDVLSDMKVVSRHFPCAQDFPNLAHLR
jgi:hypothetical protein